MNSNSVCYNNVFGDCSSSDRRNFAKKLLQGKGRNVSEQRADRRQRLVEKFKSLRIQAIDSFRKLEENEITYEMLLNLKDQILSTLDQKELLKEEELTEFFNDLEEELKEMKNVQYEKIINEEIDTITNNLMYKCDVCDDLIVCSGICDPCSRQHFSVQF